MQPIKFYVLSTLLLVTSCTSDPTAPTEEHPTTQVTINVTDFTTTQEPFPSGTPTRATSVADYDDLKLLTLVCYSGTTPIYQCTQNRNDATTYTTFGHFSCTLPMGTYQLVVIGRTYTTGDSFTLTSATEAAYTSEKVRDTFSATQPLTLSTMAPQNLNLTLTRITSMLRVVTTDNRPTEATQIRTTYSAGSKGFNPTTGLATTNTGFTVVNHPSTAPGNPVAIYSYLYLYSDEQTMDITLEVLDDANHVLYTKVVPNVTLQRNRRTKLTGPLYNSLTDTSIQIDTDWLPDNNQDF